MITEKLKERFMNKVEETTKSTSKAIYTEEDMRNCFESARLEYPDGVVYSYFEDYIKTLNKK